MAAASGKHKDTYRATAVFLVLTGLLYLIDKWIGFGHLGLPWVMQKIRCCCMQPLFFCGSKVTNQSDSFY